MLVRIIVLGCTLGFGVVLACTGPKAAIAPVSTARTRPEFKITYETNADPTPPFEVDPKEPFEFGLAQGTYTSQFDTVMVDQSGAARLWRFRGRESATVQIPAAAMAELLRSVQSNKLTQLDRVYSTQDVEDGSQWIFILRQGDHTKMIYMDNYFPEAFTVFFTDLQAALHEAGAEKAVFKGHDIKEGAVPEDNSFQFFEALRKNSAGVPRRMFRNVWFIPVKGE